MIAPAVLSFREFATLAGFKPGYITQLRKAERLVLTDDGRRVRVPESLALLEETRDPGKAGVVARHAAARAAGVASPGPSASGQSVSQPDGDDAEPPTFQDPIADSHARRRAKAMADKAETDAKASERDYRLSMGELLEAGEVDQALQAAATTFRTSLENLPSTLAPELAAATDEGRVRVLLQEAIEHALEEISRQFAALGREIPQ